MRLLRGRGDLGGGLSVSSVEGSRRLERDLV